MEHISPEDFKRLYPNATASAKAANALEWARMVKTDWSKIPIGPAKFPAGMGETVSKPKAKRIRQDTKPLLNKTEERALEYLKRKHPSLKILGQSIRFRLANGLWYKPDLIAFTEQVIPPWVLVYEVKGPHAFRGGFENLKMAASVYRDFAWFLLWEDPPRSNNWLTQEVLS